MKLIGNCFPYGPSDLHPDIKPGAFGQSNGFKVPVVTDFVNSEVIGHALLEERMDGMYAIMDIPNITITKDDITKLKCGGHAVNIIKDKNGDVIKGRIVRVAINDKCIEPVNLYEEEEKCISE